MSNGKSVKLFLVDGSIGGLVTAEIMNWTGHVVSAPRSKLAELFKREEVGRTGVYILLGDNPDAIDGQSAYIGEADLIKSRLLKHAQDESKGGKDFWNQVVAITSKDANLTKAHARYLESSFISLAKQARRATLVNGTNPDTISLPEADISDMEFFIAQTQIILPVLGINLLRVKAPISEENANVNISPKHTGSPIFEMQIPKGGIAKAQEIDGEFTVLAGSKARSRWAGKTLKSGINVRKEARESLISNGTLLAKEDGSLVFSQNQVFNSPSAAASIIAGTETRNGRVEWKVEGSGITFGEWQNQQIES